MPASYENDRNYLLDYMLECTSKLKLSFNTYHLAVYYLDSYVINRKKQMDLFCYKVFAATSLMLAGKHINFIIF